MVEIADIGGWGDRAPLLPPDKDTLLSPDTLLDPDMYPMSLDLKEDQLVSSNEVAELSGLFSQQKRLLDWNSGSANVPDEAIDDHGRGDIRSAKLDSGLSDDDILLKEFHRV